MSLLEGDGNFKWGNIKAVNGSQRYESFIYKGVEYFLYDCIYVLHVHSIETSIGKIVKMWDEPTREKMVKVIYFFRPRDIINFLKSEPRWNELFLACGEGEGVCDTFEVGKILGKCNVFYKSDDERNPPASDAVKEADYYFSSTFNVGTKKVSTFLPEVIQGVAIQKLICSIRTKRVRFSESCFPERNNGKKAGIGNFGSGTLTKGCQKPKDNLSKHVSSGTKNKMEGSSRTSCHNVDARRPITSATDTHLKRRRDLNIENEDMPISERRRIKEGGARVSSKEYKRSTHSDSATSISTRDLSHGNKSHRSGDSAFVVPQTTRERVKDLNNLLETEYKINAPDGSGISLKNRDLSRGPKSLPRGGEKAGDRVIRVNNRPPSDVSKWFNEEPWEDRLQSAHQEDRLVFLTNLDPSYASCDIEDILYSVFQVRADARIIPRVAHSSPHYGQAFAIFRSKDTADKVITKLKRKNLMQLGGRPIVALRKPPGKLTCSFGFPGHFVIGDPKLKRSEAQGNAVSTAHSAQSNTLEYDFALEWRLLQEQFDFRRKKLHQIQEEERLELLKQLKEGATYGLK